MMLNILLPTTLVCRRAKKGSLAHIHGNIGYYFVPRICLRAENNDGDHIPWRNHVTNQDCQSITLRTKKIIIPTNFCGFHAINNVLLERLLHLLGFYHSNINLSEIVLLNAGLLE